MLPRDYLRENAGRLVSEMPERFAGIGLETYPELDRQRREVVTRLEEKRRRRHRAPDVPGAPAPAQRSRAQARGEAPPPQRAHGGSRQAVARGARGDEGAQ